MSCLKFNKVIHLRQVEIVKQLADEIWSEHFTNIIGQQQVMYMLDKFQTEQVITEQISKNTDYFLITRQQKILGYMAIKIKGRSLFLSKLYLLLSERGKGYARQSILFLRKTAKNKRLNTITLTVNKGNRDTIKVYQRLGFIIKDSRNKDIGSGFFMDDYVMEMKV